MRKFLGSVLTVAISFAIAVVLGEVVVRAVFKDDTVMFPRYHTDYRYGEYTLRGIRPNAEFRHTSVDGSWTFVTNSRGLRDAREFPYEKPAGTLRVLALGDSHTQGYEVRQDATYSAVLERALIANGFKAEVLNAGVSGFSTAEELAYLEAEGYRYQPDVVVLGFFANDYEDNLKAGLFALENGQLAARKHEHLPGVGIQNAIYAVPGVSWLSENSYFYSVAFNTVWVQFKNMAAAHAKEKTFDYAIATKAQSKYDTDLAAALVERMHAFCARRGIRFIVVDIPQGTPAPYRFGKSVLFKTDAELVDASKLLAPYAGAVQAHLPHGHNHISEFTHALIGAELGRRITERK
ncbi:MAG TPA: GDSL-type esterase/lipase family protein [Burkholderiales bacterium]|nr:GDSL-type esterase/lipase family protein [Burkholderiales bacterium]